MLVDAHAGGVDHDQFAVETSGNRRQQPVPRPRLPPTDEPIVAGRRWPITFRDLRPGRTGAEAPKGPLQHAPAIDPGRAARLVGQQRLDDEPFLVCQSYRRRAMRPSNLEGRLNHAVG